ncbi:ion channel protein [Agromyces endophyticus]|uniref:ion channel protein n=1 Tax=Agromyces sp. H17E-10 TaxID=2932244 RepID=UPI001FD01527|nr:ion channel protein [Agromyces sp. H17E-10]UOQ87628.1 ion channel protein [Agromyces sp. H17E-10]
MDETRPAPRVRDLAILAIPTIVVGVGSAFLLWLLDLAAEGLHDVIWDAVPEAIGIGPDAPLWIFTVLTLTGAAVGAAVWLLPGHGGPDSALGELDAPPPKLIALPSLALVVTIGLAGGVSLGPENPIIGINTALTIAVLARVAAKIPTKLAATLAMAATIGALFGTPVAAALVLTGAVAAVKGGGSLWDKLFLPLAAAGAGAMTMHLLGGSSLTFTLQPMGGVEAIDLLTGTIVACIAALVGLIGVFALPVVHRIFHSMRNPLVYTTIGGALLGVLGIIGGPITLFKGLNETGELLANPDDYSPGQLALFAAVKLVALVIAAAAGFRGGRVFPIVFIGTALGLLAYAVVPDMPISLAVACAVLGITLVATRDGWIGIFLGAAIVGDTTVLPLLCVIVLPVWLIVTKAPEFIAHDERPKAEEAAP